MSKEPSIYHAVIRRKSGPVHLSVDSEFTLCGWSISDHWQRHDELVALFDVLLANMQVCPRCQRAAIRRHGVQVTT